MTRRFVSLALAVGLGLAIIGCSTVPTPAVASVAITGSAPTVGGTSQLTAVVTFADGSIEDVTGSATQQITWQSSNPAVATVSSTGIMTAVADGSVVITATFNGVGGTVTLQVTG